MKPELTDLEARVIGCLIEKAITTPDNYPLTLNALTQAANQKSNRDPVLSLGEGDVQTVLDRLMKKHLVTDRSAGHGGRVVRYSHRFCNTRFGELTLSEAELAIVCELLLRGPQTPGELRSRARRMAPLADVGEVEAALAELAARDEPLVVQLAREPGRRESRWAHCFGTGTLEARATVAAPAAGPSTPARAADEAPPDALAALRAEVDELRARLEALEQRFSHD